MSTGLYENLGVRFQYPENWMLSEEQANNWPRAVTLEVPGGGFWALKIFPDEYLPGQIAAEALRAMRREYDMLEAEMVQEPVGKNAAVGYDLDFYCLDLIVRSKLRAFQCGANTYLLQFQAEDREFVRLDPIFAAITTSFITHLDA